MGPEDCEATVRNFRGQQHPDFLLKGHVVIRSLDSRYCLNFARQKGGSRALKRKKLIFGRPNEGPLPAPQPEIHPPPQRMQNSRAVKPKHTIGQSLGSY